MMATSHVAFGATPLEGEQHQRPGKAGSAVFWLNAPSMLDRSLV